MKANSNLLSSGQRTTLGDEMLNSDFLMIIFRNFGVSDGDSHIILMYCKTDGRLQISCKLTQNNRLSATLQKVFSDESDNFPP